MSLRFRKKVEDFVCGHCGTKVVGSGFTNHCNKCLWSKHVDIFPGDRSEECAGLMEPVGISLVRGKYVITHKCVACGAEKRNRTVTGDKIEILLL